MSDVARVYLGLGSNLGDRADNLAQAIRRLGQPSPQAGAELALPLLRPLRASSVYETAPWGYADQPAFLNCVLEAETGLAPLALLALGQRVERELGRQPTFRYGPRLVDVDILLYGDLVLDLPQLQVPHPRMAQRAFVLVPLAELAPELVHPTLRLTIAELARRVDGKEGVKLWSAAPPL
ncbi:MAG TPA: 2-amino-4-hydroxy-6-hydroxymethyldihydropteridine diphosphokinase [Dehalococcoidia bacterium]|nr:2-amino-4-hydroxy-6-hydroxymethyldihydropteridine diphosphokinase [Dehalococcoidia bacterium]